MLPVGLGDQFAAEVISAAVGYADSYLTRVENDVRALDAKATSYISIVSILVAIVAWTASISSPSIFSKIAFSLALVLCALCVLFCYQVLRARDVPSAPTPKEFTKHAIELSGNLIGNHVASIEHVSALLADINGLFMRSADQIDLAIQVKTVSLYRLQAACFFAVILFIVGVVLSFCHLS